MFAIATIVASPSCAASHSGDGLVLIDGVGHGDVDADVRTDGGGDTDAVMGEDLACRPELPMLPKIRCDAEYVAACTEWALQIWSGPGYVHTHCEEVGEIAAYCTVGNYCDRSGDHFPPPTCQCQRSLTCNSDEVCVSDTPDGPPRCVPRCS